ncbi:hypothetical protein JCGZ_19234 [Jatropha curcas]|uniref:Uncharacterized protein n=1 Tax=Jatropha curcas TaxID=180498 RepID=A0A067JZW8_JATCU|nr:hypothetical protein JCGZ_19234 [Jatropha curcas]
MSDPSPAVKAQPSLLESNRYKDRQQATNITWNGPILYPERHSVAHLELIPRPSTASKQVQAESDINVHGVGVPTHALGTFENHQQPPDSSPMDVFHLSSTSGSGNSMLVPESNFSTDHSMVPPSVEDDGTLNYSTPEEDGKDPYLID